MDRCERARLGRKGATAGQAAMAEPSQAKPSQAKIQSNASEKALGPGVSKGDAEGWCE